MAAKRGFQAERQAFGRKTENRQARRQLHAWLLAGFALLFLLALATLYFWPQLFSINNPQESQKIESGGTANVPNENAIVLKRGERAFIGNGYSLVLEESRGCTAEADGTLVIRAFDATGRKVSSSQMWFGGFDVEHAGINKFFLVAAINGFPSGIPTDTECIFGNGLKSIENVSLRVS